MNLFIIAGFLGSGKTSLLLSVAKAVSESGRKMAIIENEVGDVGVDAVVLAGEGLPVKEIYSGCICCSLRVDLITTLLELEREFDPDIVILEPSGVASARQVLSALQGYGGEIDRKHVAVIIDAERFQKLTSLNIPLITDGIHAADIVVLNKIDLVKSEELESITEKIQQVRPDSKIINVSVTENINVSSLVEEFMAVPDAEKSPDRELPFIPSRGGMEPVPYAHSYTLVVDGLSQGDIGTVLANLIQGIGNDLEIAGCKVIGHIKAVAKSPQGGYLMASATSIEQRPHLKGRLPSGKLNQLEIALNVIVYGVEEDQIAEIVAKRIPDHG
jgi:Ni2+-binding GTPase involved in maturation of urease and hydrogenase